MRYIKFRSLQRMGNKKIELVRVTDNGKIIPKGYGPLELQVLEGNAKDQGVNITPGKILCYGATNTIDDITIDGAVDVYIDGIDSPVLTNVTEEQLRNFTGSDFQNLLRPYERTLNTPTETFHFLIQSPPKTNIAPLSQYQLSMIFGVKFIGEDIRWYTTNTRTGDDYYSNRFFTYSRLDESFEGYVLDQLANLANASVNCNMSVKQFIKPDDIYTKLKHGEYFRKLYSGFISATDEKPYISKNGAFSVPCAVNLKFELDPQIEYVVFPSVLQPYGNSTDKFLINTTMMYDNIVHYQDGSIVTNDQTVPSLPSLALYQQDDIALITFSSMALNTDTTFDISQIQPVYDQVTLKEGRYVDVIFDQSDFEQAVFRYTTTDTEMYQTQGINWLDYKLGGRQTQALTMAMFELAALTPVSVNFLTLSPDQTKFQVAGLVPEAVYRIKFPADVTEFILTLS